MIITNFKNKNQIIINFNDGSIVYQSYDSIIAKIKDGNIKIFSNWDYSRTTRKHLKLFIIEYLNRSDLTTLSLDDILSKLINDNKLAIMNDTNPSLDQVKIL